MSRLSLLIPSQLRNTLQIAHGLANKAEEHDTQVKLNNPQNYRLLPPKYTKGIKVAGKRTQQSDHVADLFK